MTNATITYTKRALTIALLKVEAEFAKRCAMCADHDVGPVTASQWREREQAYLAAVRVLEGQA